MDGKTERDAIYWLLRAYDSGHRKGWEPGPTTSETMDGLFHFLCNLGYDPNARETFAWLREYETPPPQHVCGLRGFADSGDTCPACAPAPPRAGRAPQEEA